MFRRTLSEEKDFAHEGEFYTVRGARSGLRPAPQGELLSFGGSSPAGLELAARYAEVYAIAPLPLTATRLRIAEVRAAAAAHGRSLRIWRPVGLVLGRTDEQARARARRVGEDAVRLSTAGHGSRHLEAVQLDRDRERGRSVTGPGVAEITAYVRRSLAAAFVGSPGTVADRIDWLRSAGVDIVQLDTPVETDEDRSLRRELVTLLRNGRTQRRRGW